MSSRTINGLRRDAAKMRRRPNFTASIQLRMWREAKEALDRGHSFPLAKLGAYEEWTAPGWITGRRS